MRHFMTVDSPDNGDTSIWCVEKAGFHDALARIRWAQEDGFPVNRVLAAANRLLNCLKNSDGYLGTLYRPDAIAKLIAETQDIISKAS